MPRLSVTVASLSAVALLTACGSTVQLRPGAELQQTDGGVAFSNDGLGGPQAASGGGAVGAARELGGGGSPGEAAGAPAAPVNSGTSTGSSQLGPDRPTAGQPPASGRGVTATQILVGFITEQDDAGIAASLGAGSLTGGDHVAEVNAIVKDLNARGGVLGRKIVAVFQKVRTSDTASNPAAAAQGACVGLTEDKRVFAAISLSAGLNFDVMFKCMAEHGTPLFASDLRPQSRATYRSFAPYAFGSHTLTVERLAPALVNRLHAQRFFSGWDTFSGSAGTAPAKVGIFYIAGHDSYLTATRKALADVGQRSVETFAYQPSLSSISSDVAAAVLRFRTNGVTHVMIEEGSALLFFTQEAESQGYRPRYGLSTLDAPATLLETGAVPARQFVGSVGAGYLPLADVGNQSGNLSPAQRACRDTMRAAGQDTTSATAFLFMVLECDNFHLIAQALTRGGTPTVNGLRSGLDRLGAGFVSAATFTMHWSPAVFDAVAAVRDFHYQDGRFVYTGMPSVAR